MRCLGHRNCSKLGNFKGGLKGRGWLVQNGGEGGRCMADEAFSAPHPIGNRSSNHPPAVGKKFWGPPIQTRRF